MDETDVKSSQGLGRALESFTVKEILIGHIDATEKRLDRIEAKLDKVDEGITASALALVTHSNKPHAGAVGRAELYGALITIAGIVVGAIVTIT